MKTHNYLIIFFFCLSCNWPEEPEPDIGRLPELKIEMSPEDEFWEPEGAIISGGEKGLFFKIFGIDELGRTVNELRISVNLERRQLDWDSTFILDKLVFPDDVSASHQVMNPNNPGSTSLRRGNRPEWLMMKIITLENNEQRLYASGDFRILVCNNTLNPPCFQFEGAFENVQVFLNGDGFDEYEWDLRNYFKQR